MKTGILSIQGDFAAHAGFAFSLGFGAPPFAVFAKGGLFRNW